jgi:hypothetical protein
MHTVKDCVFGLMEREHPEANEVFVPKTISNCVRLANESTSVVACIVDLAAGNYIWADVESQRMLPTLENAQGRTAEVLASLVHGSRMSVHELLMLHAQCRGTVAPDPGAAELALRWEDLVTDYASVARYMTF